MIVIRPAVTPDEFRAIYRFRYAVYVEEMARPQKHADHLAKFIIDPLDVPAACVLAAWEAGEIVGTVRTNFLSSSCIGEYTYLYMLGSFSPAELAATSITTRLMVHPRHRRTLLATRLCCEAYRGGLDLGITTNFIDCNTHLVEYFAKLGYRIHRTNLVHPEYGVVSVMRLDLMDYVHLEAVCSPFRRLYHVWNQLRSTTIPGE